MARTYTEELVWVESEDGIAHAGAVIRPAGGEIRSTPVVWIHGFTGRFYEPHALRIGQELARQGYVFVTGNNRGHDFGAVLHPRAGEPRLGGAAWELLDESPFDVSAWIGLAVELGFRGVALLGHSLGALKVAHYQAQRQDPRVVGLIVASPPLRLGPPDPEMVALAERLVAEGRGQDLLPWGMRGGAASTVSAQTLLNRVKTGARVVGAGTTPSTIAQIRCPLLAFLGTNEEWIGTSAELEALRRDAIAAPRVDTRMLEGADHVYTGCEPEVARIIGEWVGTLG